MKKPAIIIIAIAAILLTGLTTAWAKNFYITLILAGYKPTSIQVIDTSNDENEKEFKVIKTRTNKNKDTLAILTKNALGIWKISETQENTEDSLMSTIGWVKKGELKRFSFKDGGNIENEWNVVYTGNNAAKLIYFNPGQLPENITVNIQQNGTSYLIHVISFADSDILSKFNVSAILEENGCLTTK